MEGEMYERIMGSSNLPCCMCTNQSAMDKKIESGEAGWRRLKCPTCEAFFLIRDQGSLLLTAPLCVECAPDEYVKV